MWDIHDRQVAAPEQGGSSSRSNVARPNVDEKRAQIGPGCYRVYWAWRVLEPSLTHRCLGSEERNSRVARPATCHLANASSRRSSERQRDKETKKRSQLNLSW
ncbi:hypothetical protein I7I48_01387 [Histoplasma ohiense]|nr:hypothetical protein I7I48_01387 [Histoplasma ohiense (nom. inval.)]